MTFTNRKTTTILALVVFTFACGVRPPKTGPIDQAGKQPGQDMTSAGHAAAVQQDYPIKPLSFTQVNFKDDFWAPRLSTHKNKTLKYTLDQCEETGRINNFRRAAGQQEGSFCTVYPFDDSDVFKILEGAAYSLHIEPDPVLEAKVDSIIAIIAAAQEPDGYLYSNRTINPDSAHVWAGSSRWELTQDLSHELYNSGHLFEAAAAHYWATGKRSLLDIALKNADLIDRDFGWGKIERPPGHQVIEMGLAKLYRVTGEARYLKLAQFFLDVRGPGGSEYSQAHAKVIDQAYAVGHAVRATYMYAGMADIAALSGNKDYIRAIDRIWEDVVAKKMYVTGGIGATGDNEGFAADYELPNFNAYCETCASIAYIFWNYRLFLMHGQAKYMDVLERTLYNALSSGVSISGDRFFYPNVLEARKNRERSPWFTCACCPSNIARFIPSVPGYQYAHRGDEVFVNLYIGGEATLPMEKGNLTLTQETKYPWDGDISIKVEPAKAGVFDLKLRIPGWARNEPVPSDLYRFMDKNNDQPTIKVNGIESAFEIVDGYASIRRTWTPGDEVRLYFPMPVRRILAHPKISDDQYKVAIQRGPLVYCLEGQDQTDERVIHLQMDINSPVRSSFKEDLLDGVQTVSFNGFFYQKSQEGEGLQKTPMNLQAIPYYAWANRGKDYMTVWVPYDEKGVLPAPNTTLATRCKKTASEGVKGNLEALADQFMPKNANDKSNEFIHWWPRFGQEEWVQYDFEKAQSLHKIRVYWLDDAPHGGCRIPATWKLLYRVNGDWQEVKPKGAYATTKDAFDILEFEQVTTSALKLVIQAQEGVSVGLLEWEVE
ncbi:MAG: glycoside hydrolase family 127 protein [Saprospiraceae bacterium]